MEENAREEVDFEIVDMGVDPEAQDGPDVDYQVCCWGVTSPLLW